MENNGLLQRMRRSRDSYLLMLPYLLFFTVFTLVPVIVAIVVSFTEYNMLTPAKFVFLDNYIRMFLEDNVFLTALSNMVKIAVIIGPFSYILCFFIAWVINDLSRTSRSILTTLFYVPAVVGGAAWAVWRLLLSGDQYGLINNFLMSLGIIFEPIAWTTEESAILPVIIVVQLWMSMGISFLSFIAGMQTVDISLYEAGMIDGIKNRFQELWYVTLPSMLPQLVFGAVMQIISAFTVADVSVQLCGLPSTNYAGETIVTHIMDYGTIRYEFGYACAMSVVLVLLMQLSRALVTKMLSKVGS